MKIISQETKDKIRNSHIGIKLSDETKKKISDAHKNKTIPNNVRDKISKSLNGIKKTKTHCLNISKSRKGRGLVGFEEKSPNWKGGMIIVSCSYCGCDIKRYAQRTITNDMQFCNRKCHGKWRSENLIGEKSTAWKKDSDCITLRKKRMRTSMKYKAWREDRKSVV